MKLTLAALTLLLCQCTQVRWFERDRLQDYGMRPDRDALHLALGEHVYFSREAASGGRGIGGGGCGCN